MPRPAGKPKVTFRSWKASESGLGVVPSTEPVFFSEFSFSDVAWNFEVDHAADREQRSCQVLCSVPYGQWRAVHNAIDNSGDRFDTKELVRDVNAGVVRGREEIRAVFDEIDADRDGNLSEAELRAYAAKHRLPTTYVREFLDQARYGWRSVHLPWGALSGQPQKRGRGFRWPFRIRPFLSVSSPPVNYSVFEHFVAAKDEAIRASFQRIDSDGDGRIRLWELEKGLEQVRVMCGYSGQHTPVKRSCLAKMMKKMSKGRGDEVSYQEFRDFFTLLPTSDQLVDFWLAASCCAAGVDTGGHTQQLLMQAAETPSLQRSKVRPWNHLLAGGMAGAISRTATAPLETMRLRMMTSRQQTLALAVKQTMATGGWRAFFKGNLANVVRSAPQKAIDFFAFEAYKSVLPPNGWGTVSAGALAGATSTVLLYPLEVVRSRLTTSDRYSGILDAWVRISKVEGAGALYKGLRPSIISILPEAAITYGCFDLLKAAYKRVHTQETIGVLPALVCGVSAAFTGQLVAYPLELVARRSQLGGSDNILVALRSIVDAEGWRGLYRGVLPASAKVIPMACVSFAVYESVRAAIQWAEAWEERRKVESLELEEEEGERIAARVGCLQGGMARLAGQVGLTWA